MSDRVDSIANGFLPRMQLVFVREPVILINLQPLQGVTNLASGEIR